MEPVRRVETLESEPSLDNNDLDREEDEEEEDVDFNPFLKDSPSREPSSSLSSEAEATIDGEIVNSIREEETAIQNSESASERQETSLPVLGDMIQTQKPVLMSDEEDDAICKRTRAKYSLESFTLDDLEAFLQETDDEDDVPNVDDEEEYRKFLAAVLHSGGDDDEVQLVENGNNDDDDDEDNDLDFEIELEEALETDDEETIPEKVTIDESKSAKRRPVTRQKRRQSISNQRITDSPEGAGRVLRPLVPILPIAQPVRRFYGSEASSSNGFSQAQMGELHCLIQDHLQLLIQVYTLCALEHSRQSVGTQVQGLISEMIRRKDECVSRPSHLLFTGSVQRVVDQAGRYLVDVSTAVRDYRRCQLESGFDASQRVPLFPLPHQEVGGEMVINPRSALITSKSPLDQQQSKKTLAATLVESAKKQSVALVHKDIAKLAKRFLTLFKVSLFPHKPPAAAVINRFLFTDTEDELLALGIMEYNSNWKAIKQRFLPCKGEHQIYVRQKNRRSSKAPENSIKAVLRMKTSPLTPQEVVRIQEGLKYFKYDWTSVWRLIVPYRDPSSLPRQWRTALGIQKSYKLDPVKKEKRRLYETEKRKQLATANEDRSGASKANRNHVGDGLVDNSGGAYLHEGFLADWRHGMPTLVYSTSIHSFENANDIPRDRHESLQTCTGEGSKNPEVCSTQILTCTERLGPSFMPLYHHTSSTAPGSSIAPITARPHGARDNRSVVRLAPDLPPVNLPSSVRVISQSAFAKNQPDTASKTCIVKDGVSNVSGRRKLSTGPPCFQSDGDNNGPPSEKVVDLREDVPAESSSGMGETNNDSALRLHPLLYRTPEHGQVTSDPSNRDPGGSSAFSFFSDNRPQLLSLFNSPRQIDHSADQVQEKSSSNKQEVALGDSCLHPLFQRNECETSSRNSRRGNLDQDIGKKGKLCQLQDTSGAGRNDVRLKPSSSRNHAKNVNLDIFERSDGSEVPGSTALSRCIDEMAEQSNQGIVMEQEELSDSDEEMMEEEHVEFECEEMADSEGDEGSECEEIIEMQDKENKSSAVEIAATDVDSGKDLSKDSPNSPWLSLDPSSRRLNNMVKDIEKTEPAHKITVSQHGPSRSRRKRTLRKSSDAESTEEAGVALLRLGTLALPSGKKPKFKY